MPFPQALTRANAQCLLRRVVSMGRRNTQLEPTFKCEEENGKGACFRSDLYHGNAG